MGRVGSALDNAAAESFNSTLEHELLSRRRFATKDQARREVARFIDAYNHRRRHSSCEMLPPVAYEQLLAERAADATTTGPRDQPPRSPTAGDPMASGPANARLHQLSATLHGHTKPGESVVLASIDGPRCGAERAIRHRSTSRRCRVRLTVRILDFASGSACSGARIENGLSCERSG